MGAITEVTDSNFQAEVIESDTPVLVDFWAPWCGPCRIVHPVLEQIAQERGDELKIVKLNVDENPQISSQLGIRSIPALMMFKDGKVVAQKVGAAPKGELSRWIQASA
jgi:thioredoxin 1